MSGKGTSSRGRSSSSNARPSDMAGPSSHRFAERRQERMRGAGTAVAMQRDFAFKLPPKRSGPSAAATASTSRQADASISVDSTGAPRKRGRPRGSGPRQRERAAAAAAAAAAAEESFDSPADYSAYSLPIDENIDPALLSQHLDASSSIGVARRVARPDAGPMASTPAASRIIQKQLRASSSTCRAPSSVGQGYADDRDEDFGSQIGDVDDNSRDDSNSSGGAGVGMMDASPGWNDNYGQMDETLPMIPSPVASSSHVDASVRRMRPSIGGTSVSRLSIVGSTHGDSPAARAAQRNLQSQQQRRQGSPGSETQKRRGRPPKAAGAQPSKRRALMQEPSEYDETVMDQTMVERQRGSAPSNSGPARGKDLQRRLKRALTLVFSADSAAADDEEGDDSTRPSKRRKSAKYLNDVDIIWSIVDEELRSAIEEQPAKAPFLALKALRKSVRANFLNLSEKTDTRTTLISQLVRARKQKRLLRKDVFAKRSELAKSTVECKEREKEVEGWKKEVKDVRKVNAFLLNLREIAAAWT
ncbi:hypothetical protein NDA13_000892 [Ustilago tritici]|nr:hypothetical protein NDA13_000892 [Ustilago tritici]